MHTLSRYTESRIPATNTDRQTSMIGRIGQWSKLCALGAQDRGSNPRSPICDTQDNLGVLEVGISSLSYMPALSLPHRETKWSRPATASARQLGSVSSSSTPLEMEKACFQRPFSFSWARSSVRIERLASNLLRWVIESIWSACPAVQRYHLSRGVTRRTGVQISPCPLGVPWGSGQS